MKISIARIQIVCFLVALIGFSCYLILRVIKIPITHDEAGTILNFSTQSVREIVSYADPVPNNHILHTLLVKALTQIFGYAQWVCRLPNLIGGILYFSFSYLILTAIAGTRSWWVAIGLLFLIGNPYLVEFFALARGYGLSITWMMISIYFLINSKNVTDYYKSLLVAALGVYTNLTMLNFFIPLLSLILTLILTSKLKSLRRELGLVGLIFLILLACIIVPVYKMLSTDQFRYWGSKGFISDTFFPLIQSSLLGKNYFGPSTVNIIAGLVIILIFLSGLIASYYLIRLKKDVIVRTDFQLTYLLYFSFIYNILQNQLFNVPFLNARTALFFYPLFILSVWSIVFKLNFPLRWKTGFTIPFVVFTLWHIFSGYNLHSAYEWWFDGDNKKVLQAIEADVLSGSQPGKVRLKCNWIFQPSLLYYTKTSFKENVLPPPYTKSIDTTELVDYYYITSEDNNDWFNRNYTILKSFAWNSRYLMKKN